LGNGVFSFTVAANSTGQARTASIKAGTQSFKIMQAGSTQVFTDVPPTAQVIKTLDSLRCSIVRYQVEVKNTSPSDALSLTALGDSSFGDLLSVHDNVVATTCAGAMYCSIRKASWR